MVQINETEWDKQRKRAKVESNGLTQYDMELLGSAIRLEIPFTDPKLLVDIADMLRGFANSIEFTVQRDDLPLRARLQMLKSEATSINGRIRVARGISRKWDR